jgi:transposase
MLKRHEVQVLLRAGHGCAEVARLTGVSVSTVYRIRSEVLVSHTDDEAERKQRCIGRTSKISAYHAQIEQWIKDEPGILTVELVRRVRAAGYSGGKTAVYEIAAGLRPSHPRPLTRFEGLAGEFTQHDFGQVQVRYHDAGHEVVHFFASRLKYSRWAQVTVVPNEQVEALVRTLVDHFDAMGGVPLVAVFDRPKTVAIQWARDGEVTQWNATFSAAALDMGIGVELCWPYSPQQKGSIENLVGWVKNSFFKQRRFIDHADLEQQLAQWLDETNTSRPSRATGVIPAVRREEERPRLRPLKVKPAELALRFATSVGPTAMVTHNARHYSMAPDAIGLPATLWLYRDRVRIVAGRFEATHPRLDKPGDKSSLPEHRAQAVAAVSGKRAVRYTKREQLIGLGKSAMDYMTELLHRRPQTWIRDVDQLHELLLSHGDEPLRRAFERGLREQALGWEYISHYLKPAAPPQINLLQTNLLGEVGQ